jgi:hypothetical protein
MKLFITLSLICLLSISSLKLMDSALDILSRTTGRNQGVVRVQTAGNGTATGTNSQSSTSVLESHRRSTASTASGLINTNIAGNTTAGGATTSETESINGRTANGTNVIGSRYNTTGATTLETGRGNGSISSDTRGSVAAVNNRGTNSATADGRETTNLDLGEDASGNTETSGDGSVTNSREGSASTTRSGTSSDLTSTGHGTSVANTHSTNNSTVETRGIRGSSSTTGGSSVVISGPGTASTSNLGETSTSVRNSH